MYTCIHIGNKKPKLKDLYNCVAVKYAASWKEVGRSLNIKENILKIIEKDCPRDCEECCSRMLKEWLDLTPDATWGALLGALDSACIEGALDNCEGMRICVYVQH